MTEGTELTYDEAVALLPDGSDIHTFLNPGGMLLGADWSRESILQLLRDTSYRAVTGGMAQAMNHGLAAEQPDGTLVFIETKAEDED